MNKVILMGRLTKEPVCRIADSGVNVARYTLAVDRRFKREGEPTADFINCVVFGKSADFAEKWFQRGTKIAITGRIETGSYPDREGKKVYYTNVVVEEQELAESSRASGYIPEPAAGDGFMKLPEGYEDELPFA